jgi:stearoyl-CoA desaturase (delta-9 desaturase)
MSWGLLASFLALNLWFSGLGVSVGFHRYFTHRAFTTNAFWRYVMLIGGSLAGQGSVIFWVALHRLHHPNSDKLPDIHTPTKGFWHAYMGWIFSIKPTDVSMSLASDLIKDKWCKLAHRRYTTLLWSWWALLAILACFEPTRAIAAGAAIAGMISIHQEAIINSFCHDRRFGKADHLTKDNSRNIRWLAWLTWGQTLHNTHHAFPGSANFAVDTPQACDPGYHLIKHISHDITHLQRV